MSGDGLAPRDAWHALRDATGARIALGRAGGSLPTREWLDFKAAHALARDAVHDSFDASALAEEIRAISPEAIVVASAAADRDVYLQRPDLGRRLAEPSRQLLHRSPRPQDAWELAIVVSDGLSPLAVHRQAPALLAELLPKLQSESWRVAPIVVARFGRVALEDEVGAALGAEIALMLIGERPGLGSPDSLGAYLVYAPRVGNTDAHRNCVSNIRAEGLPVDAAAETIHYLLTEARRRQLSGVGLKDERLRLPDSGTSSTAKLPSGG
jgi:ethanolamine ammonia-lyase small subunit